MWRQSWLTESTQVSSQGVNMPGENIDAIGLTAVERDERWWKLPAGTFIHSQDLYEENAAGQLVQRLGRMF